MTVRLVLGVVMLVAAATPRAAAQPALTHLEGAYDSLTYVGRLRGVVPIEVAGSQAVVPLGGGSCFATLTWALAGATDGRTTRAIEVCLASGATDAAGLDAFLAGQSSGDPSLAFPLVPGPTMGVLTNPTTVAGQLFVRGCTGATYRKLADHVFPPGGVNLRPFTDTDGAPQLDLLPSTATMTSVASDVWADVLASCRGNDRMLPATPSPGTTSDLAGTSVLPPPAPGPHTDIAALRAQVDDLVSGGMLASSYAVSLTRSLAKAADKLRAGQAKKAIRKMTRFTRRAGALLARGLLPQTEGQLLVNGGTAVQTSIQVLAFSGPFRNIPVGCPAPVPCDPTVYHVQAGAAGVPDGSLARPFPAIADALAAADAAALCAVEVQVANGRYPDDLVITRDTAIFGASRAGVVMDGATILNQGPHELNLARLVFEGSSILGAVVVDDPCAATTLGGVRVEDAQRWGVWQQGGTLDAVDLTVSGTQATGGDPAYGTGVRLSGGVEATLVSVELRRNQGGGLAALGAGTDVSAHDLEVEDTTVNRFFLDAIVAGDEVGGAAVAALDGAALEVHSGLLSRNQYFGLFVDDAASALFEHGTVEDTRQVGGSYGHNLVVTRGATLDLVDFTSRDAALAGIAIVGAEVDTDVGEVSGCAIGASVAAEGYDIGRLQNRVIYRDNERNLDSSELPLPGVIGGF